MAVDAALNSLREAGIETALVNAGGDLAVLGFPPETEQWPIAVPGKEQSWNIPLRQGAMATSGIARRHWQQGGQQRHHLVDPRTGTSAQSGLWSVTVVAARCEQAEVAAKVAFILGKKRGADFLRYSFPCRRARMRGWHLGSCSALAGSIHGGKAMSILLKDW